MQISTRFLPLVCLAFATGAMALRAESPILLDGQGPARRFDGIGAVSGGGGTSVLLKDYPEVQRQQILDLLFKPKFGASLSALYVEIGGDGNSTQGSELSHMHQKGDENYRRGYEWWLMKEAKLRNPALTLDACPWSCPGWIGNGNFYSQDMCDYDAKWILGLQSTYGLTLDAIGCRNERHPHQEFAKVLRKTLDANGLQRVVIHGFDDWEPSKWDWCRDLDTDAELRQAIGVLGNHTLSNVVSHDGTVPDSVKKQSLAMDKPIWDTEEHVYKNGFDAEVLIVKAFNLNFIDAGATKVVNWYLVDAFYPTEEFKTLPAVMIADSPWSGHYSVREALWGYAHYGQFCGMGWSYLTNACAHLPGGGSYVTMKSPGTDYSIIAETRDAKENQVLHFEVAGGLSPGPLCVWRSNAREQFVRQPDITPVNGSFTLTLEPDSIYSLSTTSGQQKGAFADIPPDQPFPLPYRETFSSYTPPEAWGYLPHYTADIAGAFELAPRADGQGLCLRQVTTTPAQRWGPEWQPLTVLGSIHWRDYEVSCDILLGQTPGLAGIMGHIGKTNNLDQMPSGYFLALGNDGCALYLTSKGSKPGPLGQLLAEDRLIHPDPNVWHNLRLRFEGPTITAFLDDRQIASVTNKNAAYGQVGLVAGTISHVRTTASYANLIIKAPSAPDPPPTDFGSDRKPMYNIGQ